MTGSNGIKAKGCCVEHNKWKWRETLLRNPISGGLAPILARGPVGNMEAQYHRPMDGPTPMESWVMESMFGGVEDVERESVKRRERKHFLPKIVKRSFIY